MAASSGKYVCYFRVSTGEQGRSGLGLAAQRETVTRYLNGGDWTIVGEYTEVESGKRSDRPALAAALACARLHRAKLIVSTVSRLTRSVGFLSRLLESGAEIHFCDLPSISGPTNRFMLQQLCSVAELEGGLISARTRAALEQARLRGKTLGGRRHKVIGRDANGEPIYGSLVAGSAEGRAAAAKAIRQRAADRAADIGPTIKRLQAAGANTLQAIANGLNELGVPTVRGNGPWGRVQVQRVLQRLN